MLVLALILFVFVWPLGVVGIIACGVLIYYTVHAEKAFRKDLQGYISTISHRIKRAGSEVISEMPIGILLYGDDRTIEWHNPYIAKIVDRDSVIGANLSDTFPMLKLNKDQDSKMEIRLGDKTYQVQVKLGERLLYISDVTDYSALLKKYESEKMAMGILMLDNLDEVSQGMDEQSRSIMLARVVSEITDWAKRRHVYMRRLSSDYGANKYQRK
jgi:c-di-AMP phosphodiesterase-like protein